eukprot:292160-Pelagomonas_calceolata.AAC.4
MALPRSRIQIERLRTRKAGRIVFKASNLAATCPRDQEHPSPIYLWLIASDREYCTCTWPMQLSTHTILLERWWL